MTYKLELMQLKCESFEEFIVKVNSRLKELDISVSGVQIIVNDYRPDVFAIITKNVRYENPKEIDEIVWKYKKILVKDIEMVATQCEVSNEEAEKAIRKSKGDIAKAILTLTGRNKDE